MRAKILSALIASLIMIGAAFWFRFPNEKPAESLITISNPGSAAPKSDIDLLSASFENSSSTPLSTTDMFSRQLFADYADLKSRGEASPANLNFLAERYAEGILNIEPSASKVARVEQLSTIPDSAENIFGYGKIMIAARSKYALLAKQESEQVSDPSQENFDNFILQTGDLYLALANELLGIKVPASLVRNHLEIVNNYFQSAQAMRTIAESSDDPIKIYAAIQTQVRNAKKEDELFLNIAMSTNGIIWTNNYTQ